jgi:hypothetical protein
MGDAMGIGDRPEYQKYIVYISDMHNSNEVVVTTLPF